jgi:hypothetical protein
MTAKKKPVDRATPQRTGAQLQMESLRLPPEIKKEAEILGEGPSAAPKVVELLKSLEVI